MDANLKFQFFLLASTNKRKNETNKKNDKQTNEKKDKQMQSHLIFLS
jgi:hypothetical protein